MSWTTLPRSELGGGLIGHRCGSGPSLALLHGVGMRAEFWSALLPRLTPHFTVTVPDLPGHGRSTRLCAAQPTLARYSDALADMLSATTAAPWVVVGHSLGALIALDLAVRHTTLIAGLGVINSVYRRGEAARTAVCQRAAELDSNSTPDHSGTLRRWFGDEPHGENRIAAQACHRWLVEADLIGYRYAYRAFANSDAPDDDALRQVRVPALVATGALETNSTPSMAYALTALLPNAHALIVEGAGHMMPMTHGETLLEAMLDQFSSKAGNHV